MQNWYLWQMTYTRIPGYAAFALGTLFLVGSVKPPSAGALCTAAEVIAAVSGCPAGTGTCVIDSNITVDDGCTLNFDERAVRLAARMTIDSGTVIVQSGSFVIEDRSSARILGQADRGGTIDIQTTGDVQTFGSGDITVDGSIFGGTIIINAGGDVSVDGDLFARGSTNTAGGGDVIVRSGGDIAITGQSEVSALGGSDSLGGGGTIDLTADGGVTLAGAVNVRGSEGGSVDILAGGPVTVTETIDARPLTASDAGSGGEVNIEGSDVQIAGLIRADGDEGTFQSGGCGGFVCVVATTGDILLSEDVTADGASPDGSGGEISVDARGTLRVQAEVSARSKGVDGCGGGICLSAGLDLDLTGVGAVSAQCGGTGAGGEGGGAGGDVELLAQRDLTMAGLVDAAGKNNDTSGGSVNLEAGDGGSGVLTVSNLVDIRGGGCALEFCGDAGSADITGCNVTVTGTGRILASAEEQGGDNAFVAREQLQIAGQVSAVSSPGIGVAGTNSFRHPSRKPVIVTGTVAPSAMESALATCVVSGQTNPPCLVPCPECGNDLNEFPETCDQGVIPPQSCGGCSIFCQQEVCEDDRVCTVNSCDPNLGCIVEPIPNCTEPPPTSTPTSTPQDTSTPAPATPTPTPLPCVGDCNGDGVVSINELVVGVNIALGLTDLSECPLLDENGDGSVGIDELLQAVNAALLGCGN